MSTLAVIGIASLIVLVIAIVGEIAIKESIRDAQIKRILSDLDEIKRQLWLK